MTGFVVLLVIDLQFSLWGLTPRWWMRLRVILTGGVVTCLALGLWLG